MCGSTYMKARVRSDGEGGTDADGSERALKAT